VPQGRGQYVLSADELVALVSLLGRRLLVGVHIGGPCDEVRGIETLFERTLITQVSDGTLVINDDLRHCLETVTGFDALLSCTGRDKPSETHALGIFLKSGAIVALSEGTEGLHHLAWLPVLPVAIGALAGYAEGLDLRDGQSGPAIGVPLADREEIRAALTTGDERVSGELLKQSGVETPVAEALAQELARGSARRFVGVSAFDALEDLDLTLTVAAEQAYAVSVLRERMEVTPVDRVSANHLVARWLAHAYSLSLGGASKRGPS
jgi:hypothetical protein